MKNTHKTAIEVCINVLFILIAVGMFAVSGSYKFVQGTHIGARTFPILIGGLMTAFALVNITKALTVRQVSEETDTALESEEPVVGRFNILIRKYRVGAALLLMVIYYLLLAVFGFIIATLIFLPAMLYILEYRKMTHVALVTIIGVLFLYIAFKVLLGVPLPEAQIF